jgi:hypothetical protein
MSLLKSFIICFLFLQLSTAAEIGHPGGPEPEGLPELVRTLQNDNYSAELLISFATSKSGAAGHLALSVRDPETSEETVYSANFYADGEHDPQKYYTDNIIFIAPKYEYLYGTKSTVSDKACFGLDFGETYKRAVIGIRLFGLSPEQISGIRSFYTRLNEDYRKGAKNTDYHRGNVIYDYMNLNCAKTVIMAMKHGAGYKNLKIKGNTFLSQNFLVKPFVAHTPSGTAVSILHELAQHDIKADVVLYKRFENSTYKPHGEELSFKDMPNRFPSVPSLDYLEGSESFEDSSNLYAIFLFYNLGRYSFAIDENNSIHIDNQKKPMPFAMAQLQALRESRRKSKNVIRRAFRAWGVKILSGANDLSDLYNFNETESED